MNYLGLKATMIVGLLLQAIIGIAMGTMYIQLSHHVSTFAIIYGIFLSLGEVGPGSCLHVLAAKTGSSAHVSGQVCIIAAAIGKVGAFIGVWAFPQIIDALGGSETVKGNIGLFWLGSGLATLNVVVTFFLVNPLTHDQKKANDKAFHQYLEENGFDVSCMHPVENHDA
ncbi:hypothetical protein F5J12DRAFT_910973 [Pisolithus orientalis]|uniref:uncharacterized protein n=1 Tax=Pisolithus orientalis TaxID=936130 RepID=UPI00222550A7|nr:uncharacterized protein F5J12DRAFT_910973 [Pisolithus orientalis]KAI6025699.1 hypothetical protein F5J12DRAFT_910973 [Pisolithus orientalis]